MLLFDAEEGFELPLLLERLDDDADLRRLLRLLLDLRPLLLARRERRFRLDRLLSLLLELEEPPLELPLEDELPLLPDDELSDADLLRLILFFSKSL